MPRQCGAWGAKGHGMVAEIAFSMLDSATQHRIMSYISDMTIEQAASWMDEMRSDHRYDYMKPWHYINIEKGASYTPGKDENVINEIIKAQHDLANKAGMDNDAIRKDILVLMHLVGDMHQPLHVGYADDKGGNAVNVTYLDHNSNLHRVWDSEIIDHEHITLSDCMKRLHKMDKDEIAMFSNTNVESWIRQPRSQLAGVYDFQNNTIDASYSAKNKSVVEDDLVVAGIRLAAILREAFKA